MVIPLALKEMPEPSYPGFVIPRLLADIYLSLSRATSLTLIPFLLEQSSIRDPRFSLSLTGAIMQAI
jgi:hypothetical protein